MALGTEAANLFVRVTGDISDASSKLNQIGGQAEKTGGILKGAVSTALGFGAASVGLSAFGGALGAIKGGAIDMNAQLETSTLQFTTLMGSSDKAEAHVKSLFDFAAKTPFETGPIIEASRIMQTFGGDALNTKKNLTLFGDAAAATSNNINDVSFWMSRAYAAIQGGQPFGEARMRLMEMGIITPQVAQKLEDLQKSGAKSDEVWSALSGSLGRYSNAMGKQAETWDGLTSTMSDSIKMTLATAGKPLFDMLKNLLRGFNDLVASPAFQGFLASAAQGIATAFGLMGKAIGAVVGFISPVISGLQALGNVISDVFSGDIGVAMDDFANGFGVASEVFEQSATDLPGLLKGIGVAIGASIGGWVDTITANVATIAQQLVAWVVPMVPKVMNALSTFGQAIFTWLLGQLPVIQAKLFEWANAFIAWVGPMIPPFLEQLGAWALSMGSWILSTGIPMAMDALGKLAEQFLAWVGPMVAKLPGVLMQFAISVVNWLATKAVPTLVPKMFDLAGKMLTGLLDGLSKVPGALWNWFTNSLIPAILTWGPKLLEAGVNLAAALGKAFANGIAGLIEGAINALIGGINSFKIDFKGIDLGPLGKVGRVYWGGLNLPKVKLPRFEQGTLDTGPKAGLAILDPHEAVFPRDLAATIRDGGMPNSAPSAPLTVVVNIGDFHGTPETVRDLADEIGKVVRFSTIRRTAVGYGGGR